MAKKRSLPFEEARDFIRTQCIGSRKQYVDWHKANKPKQIPLYPNRSYEDVWEGWNDFLGTDNKFDNTKRKWRPLAEALVWSHSLNLTSEKQWLNYVINNRETMPKDIPSRPDVVYDDWRSWMHWCGSKPKEKVEAQQQVLDESMIFYVIQESEYAHRNTIFTFGMERGGVSALKDRWKRSKSFRVMKMYYYDEERMTLVDRAIENLSTPYYGSESIRIVPNISQLLWEISNHLMLAQNR